MSGKTVIVVDPNPGTQRRVEEAFRDTGYQVLRADDVSNANRLSSRNSIDLAFVALRLPHGHSGYELAREIRESHPAALIYLLSGGFDVYDADRAAAAGVDARVSVPFTARSLRNRVEESLRQLGLGPLPLGAGDGAADAAAQGFSGQGFSGQGFSNQGYSGQGFSGQGFGNDGFSGHGHPGQSLSASMANTTMPPLDPQPVMPAPVGDERLATFLPRDFRQAEPVTVDPAVVGLAVERAIMEVLPEVVEGILRSALVSSPSFRDLVDQAVRKALAETLPAALERSRSE